MAHAGWGRRGGAGGLGNAAGWSSSLCPRRHSLRVDPCPPSSFQPPAPRPRPTPCPQPPAPSPRPPAPGPRPNPSALASVPTGGPCGERRVHGQHHPGAHPPSLPRRGPLLSRRARWCVFLAGPALRLFYADRRRNCAPRARPARRRHHRLAGHGQPRRAPRAPGPRVQVDQPAAVRRAAGRQKLPRPRWLPDDRRLHRAATPPVPRWRVRTDAIARAHTNRRRRGRASRANAWRARGGTGWAR